MRSSATHLITAFFVCALLAFALALGAYAHGQMQEFEKLGAEAARARDENRVADACRLYEQLVKLRPDWGEGWWYLGTLYYDQGQFTAAGAAFGKVTGLEPANGLAWGMLGITKFHAGELQVALNDLTRARAVGLGGNQEVAHSVRYYQSVLLTRFGRFEEALEILVGFGIEHRESPAILDAMGAAALRIPDPIEKLPSEKREMIRSFGKATFLAAERKLDDSFKLYQELEVKYRGQPNVAYIIGVAHLLLKRDPEGALPYFKAELERDPRHVPAMLRVAFRMLETNQLDLCAQYARRLIELEPQNYAGYYLMGRVHLYSNELPQAIGMLEKSASLAPELAPIHYSLAEAYHRTGRDTDAQREQQEFTRLNPQEQAASASASSSTGQPPSNTETARAGTNEVQNFDSLKAQAEQAREKGLLADAIRLYDRLVGMRSDWAEGWWYLGSLNYELDEYEAAVRAFDKLLVLDPQNAQAWGLLGLCEYRVQRNAEALEHLTKSRQLGLDRLPEFSRVVRVHQAILLNRSAQFEAALFVLNTYAIEHKQADSVLDAMGMAVLRIADPIESIPQEQKDMIRSFGKAAYLQAELKADESFNLFTALQAQYRGQPNVAYAYGTALLVHQEPEKAIEFFKKELERDPAHDAALLQIALQMTALGKFEEGIQYSQKAIDAAPANFAGYYALGRNYLYVGDLPQSIAALEKAAQMAPTVATLQYTLSQAYQRANREADAARARAQFEKLETLNKARRADLFVSPEDLLPAHPAPPPK